MGLFSFFTAGDKWKKLKHLMKKWKRNDFVVLKNASFLYADKQELNNLITKKLRNATFLFCCHLCG